MATPASIPDDMSDIAHLLLEQFQDLRKEIRENLRDVKSDIKDVKSELKADIDDVKTDVNSVKVDLNDFKTYVQEQISGKGGTNDRLTKVETQVTKTNKNFDSGSPPSGNYSKKLVTKENAAMAGAAVGTTGLIMAAIELAKAFLAK